MASDYSPQQIPPPPATCNGVLYVVQPGDTLFTIARAFGVSLDALVAANPQIPNPNVIFPGQIICIPVPPPQCPQGFIYVVQPGDTLSSIAQMFGVTVAQLIAANPQIPNPNLLAVGQPICVPDEAEPPEQIVYTTGPLALVPDRQAFVGFLIENNSPGVIAATGRLFDKDVCPKVVAVEFSGLIEPGCLLTEAIPISEIFFYEAQVLVPVGVDVKITIYALTAEFRPLAANTLRHTELAITEGTIFGLTSAPTQRNDIDKVKWNIRRPR